MIVLYSLGPDVTRECSAVAKAARIGLTVVRRLQAACAALAAGLPTMVIASTMLKWWDRAVLEEHAARSSAAIRWGSDADVATVEDHILAWVRLGARPGGSELPRRESLERSHSWRTS